MKSKNKQLKDNKKAPKLINKKQSIKERIKNYKCKMLNRDFAWEYSSR